MGFPFHFHSSIFSNVFLVFSSCLYYLFVPLERFVSLCCVRQVFCCCTLAYHLSTVLFLPSSPLLSFPLLLLTHPYVCFTFFPSLFSTHHLFCYSSSSSHLLFLYHSPLLPSHLSISRPFPLLCVCSSLLFPIGFLFFFFNSFLFVPPLLCLTLVCFSLPFSFGKIQISALPSALAHSCLPLLPLAACLHDDLPPADQSDPGSGTNP